MNCRALRLLCLALGANALAAACSTFTPTEDTGAAPDAAAEATAPSEASSPDSGLDASDAAVVPCASSAISAAGLYVLGGESADGKTEPSEIYRAAICTNGDLGPWVSVGSPGVDYPVVFGAGGIVGNRMLLVTGQHSVGGPPFQNRAYSGLLTGGGVAPFEATDLSANAGTGNRWRALFATAPSALFVLGGEDLTMASTPQLLRVDVLTLGDAGAKAVGVSPLPEAVSRGAALVYGGSLLTFGGAASGSIYVAQITGASAIGGWNNRGNGYVNTMNAAVAAADVVYLVGGQNSPTSITRATVIGSPITSVTLQEPKVVLPRATSGAGVTSYNEFLYVTGGVDFENDVYLCKLSPAIVASDCKSGPPLPGGRHGHLLLAY